MHILVVCRLLPIIHSSLSSYITVAVERLFNLEMVKGCGQLCVGYLRQAVCTRNLSTFGLGDTSLALGTHRH